MKYLIVVLFVGLAVMGLMTRHHEEPPQGMSFKAKQIEINRHIEADKKSIQESMNNADKMMLEGYKK